MIHLGLVIAAAAIALLLPTASLAQRPTAPLQEFPTEREAQQHCPEDAVVWLNLPTGIHHFRGKRWYGGRTAGPSCASTWRMGRG